MARTATVSTGFARAVVYAAAGALVGWGLVAPASADPSATPSADPAVTASASSPAGPTPADPTPTTSTKTPAPAASRVATGPGLLTLTVASTGGPVPGAFYEDLGSYAFTGTTDLGDGTAVHVQREGDADTWATVATAKVDRGAYAVSAPVGGVGQVSFRAVAEGSEGAETVTDPVPVTVADSTVSLSAPAEVDALEDLPVSGTVVPARAGVVVSVAVQKGADWRSAATATTLADGTFATTVSYGKGHLKAYTLRAAFRAVNRERDEVSATRTSARIAVLDPEVDDTSAADVAKTYRKGCPVGRSKLSTIHLNYYGRDKEMHRGVIIVRTDLRQEIVRGFESALKHRYPIAKMNNPNKYGGNDPKQMKANNTSGFNCRKVVGNPYKMSPHSYGIAIDVNTVQNPYRDSHGKWWPSNGKSYSDRSPLRWGMLGTSSWLTRSLRSDGFFWGGFWNPGRDYQHFEYRG